MNNKYTRLLKNSILIIGGNFGSKLITFFLLPFYAIWLSVADYGKLDLISQYSILFFGLGSLSITESIFVFPKNQALKKQSSFYSSGLSVAFISLFAFLFILFISSKLLFVFGVRNVLTEYDFAIGVMMFCFFFYTYNNQFLRGVDQVKLYSISGIVLTSLIALTSFLWIPKYGVMGFVYSYILSYTCASIFIIIFGKVHKYSSFKSVSWESSRKMLVYSLPMIPNAIMWWLITSMTKPIIEHYSGPNDLGLFAIAQKLPNIVFVIFSVFLYSWQISALEEKDKNYQNFYNKILSLVMIGLVLSSSILVIFCKEIVFIVGGEKFIEAWRLIPIITFGGFFACLSGFISVNFIIVKKSIYFLYTSIYGGVACLVLGFLLIPYFGLYGAALSFSLSQFALFLSRVYYSHSIVKIQNLKNYFFLILIFALIVTATYQIDFWFINVILLLLLFTVFLIFNKKFLQDFATLKKMALNRMKTFTK